MFRQRYFVDHASLARRRTIPPLVRTDGGSGGNCGEITEISAFPDGHVVADHTAIADMSIGADQDAADMDLVADDLDVIGGVGAGDRDDVVLGVAAEDARFWEHDGVDWDAMRGALEKNWEKRQIQSEQWLTESVL
jgi:hypothetical protein